MIHMSIMMQVFDAEGGAYFQNVCISKGQYV